MMVTLRILEAYSCIFAKEDECAKAESVHPSDKTICCVCTAHEKGMFARSIAQTELRKHTKEEHPGGG